MRIVERILAAGEGQGTRAEIEARLNDVAKLGYEMRPSLAVEACINISMPVRDHTGAVIAALTVPFLPQKAARFDRQTVLERTQAAAEKISAALGAGERHLTVTYRPGTAGLIRSATDKMVIGRREMNWSKSILFASAAALAL